MSDIEDDDDFTIEELEIIAQGIQDLHLVDARMAALKHTVAKYPEQDLVAVGFFSALLDDVLELLLVWKEFSDSPFGAQFDPRIDPPDEEDE